MRHELFMRYRFTSALVVLFMMLGSVPAQAVLPEAVEGKDLPSLAPMVEKVTPAVVNISTEGRVKLRQNPLFMDPFFRRFFDFPDIPLERRTQSLGSGVIVDADRGLVVTNNHVIANADQITVTLRDGRTFKAELVGTDPETDVAVIKIPAEGLTELRLGDSDKLRVGDFVVAIGNPFGLGQTVTSGIVSAQARSGLGILGYEDFIQTDASINPGNSGGALVNLRGELVGINTAIFSQDGGNIGIGFAIPINLALHVMEQLVEFGEVQRGQIGLQIQDLTPVLAEAFGLKQREGAVVVQVMEGSPADKAGLKAGDIVIGVDGKKIKNASELRNHVGLQRAGSKLRIEILRDGARKEFTLIPEKMVTAQKPAAYNELLRGVTLGEIPSSDSRYGKVSGVLVVSVEIDTPAWRAGLRDRDIITTVNRRPVTSTDEFLAAVSNRQGPLVLRILRGEAAAFIVIK